MSYVFCYWPLSTQHGSKGLVLRIRYHARSGQKFSKESDDRNWKLLESKTVHFVRDRWISNASQRKFPSCNSDAMNHKYYKAKDNSWIKAITLWCYILIPYWGSVRVHTIQQVTQQKFVKIRLILVSIFICSTLNFAALLKWLWMTIYRTVSKLLEN